MAAAEKQSNELYIGPAPSYLARRILNARRKEVDKALTYTFGTHNFDDIVDAIEEHDMQLWNAIAGGVVVGVEVTEILCFPQKKVCNLFITAGVKLNQWAAPMLEQIEHFAANQGCSLVVGRGRTGWLRLAKKYGFADEFMSACKVI